MLLAGDVQQPENEKKSAKRDLNESTAVCRSLFQRSNTTCSCIVTLGHTMENGTIALKIFTLSKYSQVWLRKTGNEKLKLFRELRE